MIHSNAGLPGGKARSLALLRNAFGQMRSVSDEKTRRFVGGAFLLMLASSTVAAFSPLVLKVLVDDLHPDSNPVFHTNSAYLVFAYALAHWLSRSLGELRELLLGRADQRIHRQLSNEFFRHIMLLPLRFHLSRKTGALCQTLTNGLLGYRIVLFHLINSGLPILIEIATMGAILVVLGHPAFVMIISVSAALYAVAFWLGAARVSVPAKDASSAHINAGAIFTDSVLNLETVKYFNGESEVHGRFLAALRTTESRWAILYKRIMENGVAVATIFAVSLGSSAYVAARLVQQGAMSIGEFVLVNTYVIQLTRPVETLGFAFRDIAQGVGFIERMAELLVESREVDNAEGYSPVRFRDSELAFERVHFAYENNDYVLKELDFVVPPGKTFAIVGASGSGKSSLIRLLLRLLEPSKGQIYFDGVPLPKIPVSALRDAIAVVPQDPVLFNDSIAYNIGFGKRNSTRAEVVDAAKLAGIHDFVSRQPNGYETVVGERGIRLSGGQKQRLAIARAAIKGPQVLVFDEATSSLDSRTERTVLENLAMITENTTTLIIAHRLSTVMHADDIIVLDRGTVAEHGTHENLMKRGGAYAAMWDAQQGNGGRTYREA